MIRLEGLQRDQVVAKELEAQFVEIVDPDLGRNLRTPVILHLFEHHGTAGNEFLDPVRPGPERRLQRGRRDVALAALAVGAQPVVFRQHRQFTDDGRQFAVSRAVEGELDIALAGFLGFDDVLVIGSVHRAVLLQDLEREDHVVGRHRFAVVPARFLAQAVGDRGKVVGVGGGFSQQAVFGDDLVLRLRHQRFIDQRRCRRERALDAGNRHVEIVERADRDHPRDAALGRIRIDVIEAGEVGRILDVAEQREGMAPLQFAGRRLGLRRIDGGEVRRQPQRGGHRGDRAALQKMSSGNCQERKSCC